MAETTIVRPVIVLGAPRSGTTIVRNCLALHPDLWHLAGESHEILEGPFDPVTRGYESNRVEASDVGDDLVQDLRDAFGRRAINLSAGTVRAGRAPRANSVSGRVVDKATTRWVGAASMRSRPPEIRFLEKTPKNMLRVPMLARIFPDALYVHLTRNAPGNVDSLIEGWRATDRFGPITRQRFARSGYPIARQLALQDYTSKWWKFALVPGWRGLRGKSLADVAAWQYFQCNRIALDDLAAIDPARVRRVKHEDFVHAPVNTIRDLFEWAELPPGPVAEGYAADSPLVNSTRRSPANAPGKAAGALRNPDTVRSAVESTPGIDPLLAELGYS
jgi:hypothetical protein